MDRRIVLGSKEYFSGIDKIPFEGTKSDNPLAFRYYDAEKEIGGKTLENHLRFAVAYWHSFGPNGADPFGIDTKDYPWLTAEDPIARSIEKMDAAFQWLGLYHQKIHVLSEMNKHIACSVNGAKIDLGYSPEFSLETGMHTSLSELYN